MPCHVIPRYITSFHPLGAHDHLDISLVEGLLASMSRRIASRHVTHLASARYDVGWLILVMLVPGDEIAGRCSGY
jgi:hypothetical protein